MMETGSETERAQAKETLIEHNLRLVAHIAKKYQNVDEETEDMISIGTIGLIKAIDSFDSGKGKLSTYASRCIDNELLMFLRARKKTSREVSLYEPIGTDREGNEISLLDIIEQEQVDVVERLEAENKLSRLPGLIHDRLNEREKEIITLRYGLTSEYEVTQREIGRKLGISRSYPSVIIGIKLGKPLYGLQLYPYFYTLFTQPKLPKHILPQTTILVYRYI